MYEQAATPTTGIASSDNAMSFAGFFMTPDVRRNRPAEAEDRRGWASFPYLPHMLEELTKRQTVAPDLVEVDTIF